MTHQVNLRIRLGASVLLLVMAGLTHAATITVGPGADYDFEVIQAGIDAAIDGDTVLVAPGEYVITDPITFRGKAITVKSEAGPDETTIRMSPPRGSNRSSVVIFENDETIASVLEGFTITGGNGSLLPAVNAWGGGGIAFNASSGTVRNCSIVQNLVDDVGGGVLVYFGASVILSNCIIRGNSTTKDSGGGVMCWENSSATLTNCTVSENSAGYSGGGLFCGKASSMTLTGCIIRDNSSIKATMAGGGGAQCYLDSSLTMTDCLIADNYSGCEGGGVFCSSTASVTVTNCVIVGNTARWGGGLAGWASTSTTTVSNCTIWMNSANITGGGVGCHDGASATVTNSIVWGNISPKGNEIYLEQAPTECGVTYSNVASGQAGVTVEGGCTLNWGEGNIVADPCFADPENNDYHLKSQAGRWEPATQAWMRDDVTSPCIDAGDPDSDGSGETWPYGGRINMGAYGGTREASMSTRPEAMSLPRVALIYRSDTEAAESFQSLLMRYGCPTTLIGIEDVTVEPLDLCDVIVVASDAGYSSTWQGTPFVATIEDSGKPIIGLGQGGYNFFGVLELSIGRPYGGHGSKNSIEVVDPNGSLFNTPYVVDIPEDRTLQLYTETGHIGIYLWPTIPETVTVLASEVNVKGYFPLVMEHNRYLFWGFTESPLKMTEVGETLFINVVIWTANAGWEIEL